MFRNMFNRLSFSCLKRNPENRDEIGQNSHYISAGSELNSAVFGDGMDPIPCGSKQGDENASKKAAAFLIAHELKEKERGQNGKNADESFEMKEIRNSNANDSPSVLLLQKEQGFVLIGFIRSAANGVPIVIPVEEGDSPSLRSLDLIANKPGTICIYYESKSRHIELRGRFLDEEYII